MNGKNINCQSVQNGDRVIDTKYELLSLTTYAYTQTTLKCTSSLNKNQLAHLIGLDSEPIYCGVLSRPGGERSIARHWHAIEWPSTAPHSMGGHF